MVILSWCCLSNTVFRTWLAPDGRCCLRDKLEPTFLFSKQGSMFVQLQRMTRTLCSIISLSGCWRACMGKCEKFTTASPAFQKPIMSSGNQTGLFRGQFSQDDPIIIPQRRLPPPNPMGGLYKGKRMRKRKEKGEKRNLVNPAETGQQ